MNNPSRQSKRTPLLVSERASASENSIMELAEHHSARLGKTYISAGTASWKHDDLMREVRLAHGAPRRAALDRLDALNRSYDCEGDTSAEEPRSRHGLRSIGRTLANGAVAGVVLFGLACVIPQTGPVQAVTFQEPEAHPNSEQQKRDFAQFVDVMRALLIEFDAITGRPLGAGCAKPAP